MKEAIELLQLVQTELDNGATLVEIKARIKGGDPISPDPVTRLFEVTAEKTNARFAWKYNENGRMIPQIYPADNSKPSERVQFAKGARVKVLPTVIKADGGILYYKIGEKVIKSGVIVDEELYLMTADGRLV